MPSKPADQILDPNVQRVRKYFECLKGDVALAALDLANVSAVQTGAIREDVLGPPVLFAQRTHLRPDFLLDGLHQKQCGASLVLTILVKTRDRSTLMRLCPTKWKVPA
jgi:hypothetical protein